MLFESLRCRPFGPFRDRTLDLAPGMNVIHGPNESGKSTLRAALSVGLCGQRRGPGRTKVARAFDDQHRPWDDGTEWAVSVVICLADGRRVELRQDLARGVASSAHDADSHRGLSGSIMNDGAPDGSLWLGLNRTTFERVASVRQAEILTILEDHKALQEDLQRAAATARAEGTARAAVERLSEFHRERVGTDRAWTKPLRTSQEAVVVAEGVLQAAREKHGEHRLKMEEVRIHEREGQRIGTRLRTVQAILVEADAKAARDRCDDVSDWSLLFPQGRPLPPGHGEDDDLEERLATALSDWESAPEPRRPEGLAIEKLKSLIADSESREAACRAVVMESEMTEMKERYDRAVALDALFPDGEPQAPDGADGNLGQAVAVALDAWRGLPVLRPPDGPTVEEIESKIEESRKEEDVRVAVRTEAEARDFGRELGEIRRLHEVVRRAPERRPDEHEEAEREVAQALRRWEERPEIDPPSGPTEAELAGELARIDQEEIRLGERNEAVEVLRRSPVLHGVISLGVVALLVASAVTGSIASWATWSLFVAAEFWWFRRTLVGQKSQRQTQREDLSARRRDLDRAINLRRMEDQSREQARQQVERAEERIARAATDLGSTSTSADERVDFLREWLATRSRARDAFDAHRDERVRLEQMSRGRSLAELEAEAKTLDKTAFDAAEGVDPGHLAAIRQAPVADSEWERVHRAAADQREKWSAEREQRLAADTAYNAAVVERDETIKRLLDVAALARIEAENAEDAKSGLEVWQSRREERQKEFAQRTRDWALLQGLLEGRTLLEFSEQVSERQRDCTQVARRVPAQRLADARNEELTPARWESVQKQEERRRNEWNATLGKRQANEETYAREVSRRNRLGEAVVEAARSAGSEGSTPAAAAKKIQEWLARRHEERKEYEDRREKWGRYQQALDGSTPVDLEKRARELEDEAEHLSTNVDADFAARLRSEETAALEQERDRLQDEMERVRRRLDRARGESEQIEKTLPCLVELEEALDEAKSRRDHVHRLDETLGITIRLLQQAEERIHRDLAPVLRNGVRQRLAGVTDGRYIDCRVDPQRLTVEVCGEEGRWRSAVDLSRGTAEQIYLLLRVTLAEHLGKEDEPCPLILDDPTVSSDAERRDAVLEALLAIAAERQVVLFTHDQGVRDWAERHLAGDSRHRIQQLSTEAIRP